MKNIYNFIVEKLVLNKDTKIIKYKYFPQTRKELREIITDRLKSDPNADLNDIDVSNITDMSELFYELDPHDIDISKWNVSKVKDMSDMFTSCKNFSADLSNWDVSSVTNMYCMFRGCKYFNSDLSHWDVSNVKDMYWMFNGCNSMIELPKWFKNT